MEQNIKPKQPEQSWQSCFYCSLESFKSPQEFTRHLRERHCTREGGSYVCRYGYNGVCTSLPLDGVSDRDYENHVNRHHVMKMSVVEQWSVYSAAQNLPAVLNDPGRGKQYNFFTKTWGDNFIDKIEVTPSIYLPEINYSHFENYLRRNAKRYRKHTRLVQNNVEATNFKITSQLKTQVPSKEEDLSVVPEIFLKSTLPLNDAGTFNAVFPCVGKEPTADYRSGRLLQEKLSHYLDIIEVQIASQVSQKSSAFFHAMTSHDAIMEQMSSATEEVKNLRGKVQQLDQNLARNPLKLLALSRSHVNHASLLGKLRLMATVMQAQPTLQLLLSASDYVGALELIAGTQDVLKRELAGVISLRHLPSQLNEMSGLIDKMLKTEFERYASNDLLRPLSTENKVLEPERLICLVAGLLRQSNYHFLDVYKQEAIIAAQAIVKQLLIEHLADSELDGEVCLTGAGEATPNLTSSQWLQLLKISTDRLTKIILRTKAVHDVIGQTADISAGCLSNSDFDESFLSAEDHAKVKSKLHDLLVSVCDYCHEKCACLVSSQTDKNSSITTNQISEFSEIIQSFTDVCEQICGRQSPALKAVFNVQAGRYVHRFHEDRMSKLALILNTERWRIAEVPPEFQILLDQLSNNDFSSDISPSTPTEIIPNGVATSTLQVESQRYAVVGAVLMLLRFVCEYCACAQQLPVMATTIGRNLTDLLKAFNSRTCQLILGAGALEKAGLKTITSTNLALASRALQLVLWFLPFIKSHFSSLKAEGLLRFENVEKEIIDHIHKIEAKILSIMSSLVETLLKDWVARPPVPSQSFRSISKHLVKLHEAVGDILPPEQVCAIYFAVHTAFKRHLHDQLVKMNIINNGGPQHGVVTSELTFYLETLRTLKVLSEKDISDKAMDDIWLK